MTKTWKTWKIWSPDEDALLRSLWGNGEPGKSIAAHFEGRSVASVLKHGYGDLHLGPRNCRRPAYFPVWDGIQRELAGGAMLTANEIAARLKVTPHAVQKQLKLHHGTGVRVAGYLALSSKASCARRWKLGAGPDATPPERKSRREINRDHARRMRKDPEYAARQNSRARLRYTEKAGKLIRRDPAAAWF